MPTFDKEGDFWYVYNELLSDKRLEFRKKRNQKKYVYLMSMYQQYRGIVRQNLHVIRGSKLMCKYGTKAAQLDCVHDHGIIVHGEMSYPIITAHECSLENIHNFGSCLCPESRYKGRLPMTATMDSNGTFAKKAEYNVYPHICIPLINEEQGWQQVKEDSDVLVEINRYTYSPLLLDNAVLVCQYGGIISIEEVPEVEEVPVKRGSRIDHLSPEYVDWLYQAEGDSAYPYRDPNDKNSAQKSETATVGPGITFDRAGTHWDIIYYNFGWGEEKINEILDYLFSEESDVLAQQGIKVTYDTDDIDAVDEKNMKTAFSELQQEYFKYVNDAIDAYEAENEDADTNYSQQQLEAMFDVAYNSGPPEQYINDAERIIYYYLRYKDENILSNALDKVKEYGNEDNRRRINQMHLFFCEDYYFGEEEDGGVAKIKDILNKMAKQ